MRLAGMAVRLTGNTWRPAEKVPKTDWVGPETTGSNGPEPAVRCTGTCLYGPDSGWDGSDPSLTGHDTGWYS